MRRHFSGGRTKPSLELFSDPHLDIYLECMPTFFHFGAMRSKKPPDLGSCVKRSRLGRNACKFHSRRPCKTLPASSSPAPRRRPAASCAECATLTTERPSSRGSTLASACPSTSELSLSLTSRRHCRLAHQRALHRDRFHLRHRSKHELRCYRCCHRCHHQRTRRLQQRSRGHAALPSSLVRTLARRLSCAPHRVTRRRRSLVPHQRARTEQRSPHRRRRQYY